MIELNSVTKLYGEVIGVNDISLQLEPGAYGLLGPNGSGKTTFLQLLMGQIKPTLGSLTVDGLNPSVNDTLLRRIGFCPATDVLYTTVSAFDWVTYLIELHGFRTSEAKSRAAAALDQVGMKDSMHRPMGNYSRGMKQRSKLAQAIAHDPEILILDEPFTGLDPMARHEMTDYLRKWIKDGKSLILASHVLHEVEAISHSFLLIYGGRLLASGNMDDVQTMFSEIPTEITIHSKHSRVLAGTLIEIGLADSAEFHSEHNRVVFRTHKPYAVYEQLPELMEAHNWEIDEVRSDAESLQSLFDSLLRIHRGE